MTKTLAPGIREKLEAEARRRNLVFSAASRTDYQHPQFALSDLRIRTEDRGMVPFEPNEVQKPYLDEIAPGWRNGKIEITHLREIILKARKQGFSTLILALYFLDTINNPNTYTVVMAHDIDSTVNLFEIVQNFYNNLPEGTRPRTRYANRREYSWPDLGSRFFVGTAGSDDFGRGSTVNNVHGSEIASWRDGDRVASGLLQAVPAGGNVFLESTAQGIGNFYCEEYQKAEAKESVYRPHFVAWFESPKYRKSVPPGWRRTADEERLAALYGIDDEQLAWRRDKMREPGMAKKFAQEYPANAREAFISSGNPYFDLQKLEDLAVQLKDSVFDPNPFTIPSGYPDLRRHAEYLEVYEEPEPGEVYVVAADTSEGINTHGDHDYCSSSVWKVSTGVQVAHFYARIDPHTFGLIGADLGFWYNTALLAPERNNHGHTFIAAALFTKNYPEAVSDTSTGLYMHQEYDEKKQPRTRKAGYPTTSQSKYFILDELATAIENDEFHPRSRALVADTMRFVKLPGGKAGAETGHDDRVMDAAIARRMLNLRPRKFELMMVSG